jgi:hypothetical protein
VRTPVPPPSCCPAETPSAPSAIDLAAPAPVPPAAAPALRLAPCRPSRRGPAATAKKPNFGSIPMTPTPGRRGEGPAAAAVPPGPRAAPPLARRPTIPPARMRTCTACGHPTPAPTAAAPATRRAAGQGPPRAGAAGGRGPPARRRRRPPGPRPPAGGPGTPPSPRRPRTIAAPPTPSPLRLPCPQATLSDEFIVAPHRRRPAPGARAGRRRAPDPAAFDPAPRPRRVASGTARHLS